MDEFKQTDLREAQKVDLRLDESSNSYELSAATLSPGCFIKQYKILSVLGSGGMSDVFMCEDTSLRRTVAIKVMRTAAVQNADLERRFLVEGRALAKLEHANIVRVFGLEATNTGQPFLVMEYVSGESLQTLLSSGVPPVDTTLRFAAQICDALAAAHQAGIIHRDLKPSNIMILNTGTDREQIKLLDFGIAKLEDELSKVTTKTGELFGTPQYMSPEQVQGKKCDSKTDQYSLGCILYEMLSGRLPYDRDNRLATMMARLQEEPAALSNTQQLIPPHMQMAIKRLMARRPEDRFPSISDAKMALLDTANKETRLAPRLPGWARECLIGLAVLFLLLSGLLLCKTWFHPKLGPNLVQNGTFDLDGVPFKYWKQLSAKDTLPKWTIGNGTLDVVDTQSWPAADGATSIDLNGISPGSIWQEISTEPGAAYIVQLQMSANPELGPASDATFEIKAGDQSTIIHVPPSIRRDWKKMDWQPLEWSFVAHDRVTKLQFTSKTSGNSGPCIDNVKVYRTL